MIQIQNSRILITGGTGSFGKHAGVYLSKQGASEIIIYSRDEKKQWDMRQSFPQFRYMIGDVRDHSRLASAMVGVDIVFHAAALKQVPSCEDYPWEAIKTNTIGSQNVCETAINADVKIVIALSTDKAVKPVNAMGMSKALMEKIICSQNQFSSNTLFCCVRYGNVMGSRGSVIPLFRQLIAEKRPITLTIPRMTRFLLTLDQSVKLVAHAIGHARGGEIFIQKSPACTIFTLANAMRQKYSDLKSDHPIVMTGIRPGEKIHETLVNEYEMQRASANDTHFVIYPEYRHIQFVNKDFEYTSENTEQIEVGHRLDALLEASEPTQ